MELSMKEKKSVTRVTAPRYRRAKKAEKTVILDEYLENTGYNRKYAIHLLANEGLVKHCRIDGKPVKLAVTHGKRKKRVYQRYYDEEVQKALIRLWKFFRQMCAQRLRPLIQSNIEVLKKSGRFGIGEEVGRKLTEISRSQMERLLRGERQRLKSKGTCSTKHGELLKNRIPVRVFWAWNEKTPGFCEIDTVSHDGGFASGEHAFTLTVTDVCTQWTEERALKNKAFRWVKEAMNDIVLRLPVPLKGIDSDNGSEFINLAMKQWCEERSVTFTRSRSYHKNDNCYVEQKNGDVVRKTVGYSRIEDDAALNALKAVYRVLNPMLNYFYPCMKLIDKKRVDGKIKRIYEKTARTPFERIIERGDVLQKVKRKLIKTKAGLNIVGLQDSLDRAIDNLMRIIQNKYKSDQG
jgi:hypothetical protein